MSKFICLSCNKEFKVAVRAPMSCPTKHLCQVVQNENSGSPLSGTIVTAPAEGSNVPNVIREDCSIPIHSIAPKSLTRSTGSVPHLADKKRTLPLMPATTPSSVPTPTVVRRQTAPLPTPTPVVPFVAPIVEKALPPVYPGTQPKPVPPVPITPPASATPPPVLKAPESESFALDEFVSTPVVPDSQPAVPATSDEGEPPAFLIIEEVQFPIMEGNILGREGDIAREEFRKDRTVGRIHARVDVSPKNEISIRNLAHSGNPVIVDGQSIAFNQTMVLKKGMHQLQLGTRFLCSVHVTTPPNQKTSR